MPTIVTQNGKVMHLTNDFSIPLSASFSVISCLTPALPSSEEGRAAFKITESIVAIVSASIHGTFMDEAIDETIATITFDNVITPIDTDVENSRTYIKMKDENKKKVQDRLRKLLQAIAEKEALESNAELVDGATSIAETEKMIAEITFKINRLLGVCNQKPIVEAKDLDLAVEELVTNYGAADPTLDRSLINTLIDQITEAYQYGA